MTKPAATPPRGASPSLSSRPFAEQTQATIDAEVACLLREAEERAITLLRAHRALLRRLVELLIEEETVDGAAVYRLVGEPAHAGRVRGTTTRRRMRVLDAASAVTATPMQRLDESTREPTVLRPS